MSPDQAGTDFPATFQNPSPNIAAGLLALNSGYAFLLEPITNFSNDLVIRRLDLLNMTFVGWTPDDFDRSTPIETRLLRPRNQGIFATALANVHFSNLTITGTHSNAAQFFGCRNLFIENCHVGGNQPFNELPAAVAPYAWYRGSYQNYGMVFSLCRGVAIWGGSSWRSRKSHQITNGTNDVRWERTLHLPNTGYQTRPNPPDGVIFAPIVDVGHGFNHRRITLRGIEASASSWDIANPGFRKGIRDVLIESCSGVTFFIYSNPQNLVFRRATMQENPQFLNPGAKSQFKFHSYAPVPVAPLQRDASAPFYDGALISATLEDCDLSGYRFGSGVVSIDGEDSRFIPRFGSLSITGSTTIRVVDNQPNAATVAVGNVVLPGVAVLAGNLTISGPTITPGGPRLWLRQYTLPTPSSSRLGRA